jgi:hypothetical protein
MGQVKKAVGSLIPGRRQAQEANRQLTHQRDVARAKVRETKQRLKELTLELGVAQARARESQAQVRESEERVAEGRAALFEYAHIPQPREFSRQGKAFFKELIDAGDADYIALLRRLGMHVSPLADLGRDEIDAKLPYWNNPWLPPLDGIVLYALLVENNPETYIEVGSGFSTKYARRAIADHGLRTKIVSIDPHPRAEIDELCDEIIRKPYEDVDPDFFDRLQAGDMFFVDNSHRSFTGSDVTVFFTETLPYLESGVIFGVHDIFLPNDYPETWNDRFYAEQYLLMTYLMGGAMGDTIYLPVHHMERRPEVSEALAAAWPEAGGFPSELLIGGAFWMRKA